MIFQFSCNSLELGLLFASTYNDYKIITKFKLSKFNWQEQYAIKLQCNDW